MEEFKIIMSILYNKNKYIVLINKKHQKYFLRELNDGKFMYPTMQEFSELYNIFCNNEIKQNYYEKKIEKHSSNRFKASKVKFEPKVILEKTLVSLAVAISILGCAQTVRAEETKKELITIEQIQKQAIIQEENSNFNQNDNGKPLITIEPIDKDEYVILEGDSGRDIYVSSIDKFSEFLGEKNPTYEDIKNKIKQNKNIQDKYKKIILEGLENLQETMPNLNLSILNQHLERGLKIVEKTENEISKESPNAVATFDKVNSEIIVNPKNVNDEILLHELAHAITGIIMQKGEKTIYAGTESIIYFEKQENLELYGSGFSEGIADIISQKSLGDKPITNASYNSISEQLEIMLNLTQMDATDFVNEGTTEFIKKAKNVGIENIYDNISSCDMLCTALQGGMSIQPEMSVKQNLYDVLINYAKKQLQSGSSKEKIIRDIENSMYNTTFCNIVVFNDGKSVENFEIIDLRDELIKEIQNMNISDRDERE